jgi:AcrR family transcriptional regulator
MPRRAALKSVSADRRSSRPVRARQERGVRTEEAILQATLTLLATRGIHGMSLDLLSRVLYLFARAPAREMLALPTIEQRADAAWRFFEQTIRERPELRRLVLWLIFECVEERPEMRTRLQQLYRSIRDMFEQGLREVVPDAAQRRRLAIITLATFDGLFIQWLLEPDAIDVEAIHSELRLMNDVARLGRGRRKDR